METVEAAGVVVFRNGEVLLIRRGAPPRQGEWSLPGGRLEKGEAPMQAALRELTEETGVTARLLGLIEIVDSVMGEPERLYLLHDYAALWISGEPVAADDASAAGFFPVEQAIDMVSWSETARIIGKANTMFGPGARPY
jgi:8-oxo-dGTP diphosphatase